jgi:hypothetical protein
MFFITLNLLKPTDFVGRFFIFKKVWKFEKSVIPLHSKLKKVCISLWKTKPKLAPVVVSQNPSMPFMTSKVANMANTQLAQFA